MGTLIPAPAPTPVPTRVAAFSAMYCRPSTSYIELLAIVLIEGAKLAVTGANKNQARRGHQDATLLLTNSCVQDSFRGQLRIVAKGN